MSITLNLAPLHEKEFPMKDPKTKPAREELIAMLSTPGWHLVADNKVVHDKDRTLEELVRTTHARHTSGQEPGLISRIENAFELDLIQLQELWAHLGLPV